MKKVKSTDLFISTNLHIAHNYLKKSKERTAPFSSFKVDIRPLKRLTKKTTYLFQSDENKSIYK